MVKATKAGVGVEPAEADSGAKAEPDIDREACNDHRSAITIETDECGAAIANPPAVPSVIGAYKETRGVGVAVVPTVWIWSFTRVTLPRGVTNIAVPNLDTFPLMIVDTDNLVRSIDPEVKAGMAFSHPVALRVECCQTSFSFDSQVMQRRLKLSRLRGDVCSVRNLVLVVGVVG